MRVTWEEARTYCQWLSMKFGMRVRLPGEAEWEAACRAGRTSEYAFGDDPEGLREHALWAENGEGQAQDVASAIPNAWELYDLHGNIWEWCEDRWNNSYRVSRTVRLPEAVEHAEVLEDAPTDGRAWMNGSDSSRIVRGGSWLAPASNCRSAFRFGFRQTGNWSSLGLRPALTLPPDR